MNRSLMGNLHVLESFARNDGHQGSLDVEKLKAHEQEVLRRKSSRKLGIASGNSRAHARPPFLRPKCHRGAGT